MARRNAIAAILAVDNEAFNRWRILLRHHKFQNGVNRLRRQYRTWVKGLPITRYTYEFGDDDVVVFGTVIPRQTESKISRKDVDLFDECDPNDPMLGMPEGAWHNFNSKWGIYLPKAALSEALPDLRQDTIDQWTAIALEEPAIVPLPVKAGHSRRKWLRLDVNLSYPRDILIERIDRELSKAMPQRSKTRRRWDKFGYYLKVYDAAKKGEPFTAIARTLRKRLSTVKSAWLAIGKAIYYCNSTGLTRIDAHRHRALPAKKKLVLMDVDPATHISHCERCKKAQTVDEMCLVSQIFTKQDTHGQRELPVGDIEKLAAARLKRQLSRRKPALDQDPASLKKTLSRNLFTAK